MIGKLLKEKGLEVEPIEIKHRTLVDELAELFPRIRNFKAHGIVGSSETPLSAMLAMELARGIILQLFPESVMTGRGDG